MNLKCSVLVAIALLSVVIKTEFSEARVRHDSGSLASVSSPVSAETLYVALGTDTVPPGYVARLPFVLMNELSADSIGALSMYFTSSPPTRGYFTIDTTNANSNLVFGEGFITSDWEVLLSSCHSRERLSVAALCAYSSGDNREFAIPPGSGGFAFELLVNTDCAMSDYQLARTIEVKMQLAQSGASSPSGMPVGPLRFINGAVLLSPARRGDLNHDAAFNAVDVVSIVNYVFRGIEGAACPPESADVNCDQVSNVSDVVDMVNVCFRGGALPCQP